MRIIFNLMAIGIILLCFWLIFGRHDAATALACSLIGAVLCIGERAYRTSKGDST